LLFVLTQTIVVRDGWCINAYGTKAFPVNPLPYGQHIVRKQNEIIVGIALQASPKILLWLVIKTRNSKNFHFSNLLAASEAGCWKYGIQCYAEWSSTYHSLDHDQYIYWQIQFRNVRLLSRSITKWLSPQGMRFGNDKSTDSHGTTWAELLGINSGQFAMTSWNCHRALSTFTDSSRPSY
jgi:hypothetical protein